MTFQRIAALVFIGATLVLLVLETVTVVPRVEESRDWGVRLSATLSIVSGIVWLGLQMRRRK